MDLIVEPSFSEFGNPDLIISEKSQAVLISLDGRVFVSGDSNPIINFYNDLPASKADVNKNAIKCSEILKQYII